MPYLTLQIYGITVVNMPCNLLEPEGFGVVSTFRTIIDQRHAAQDLLVEFVFLADLNQFRRIQRENKIEIQTGTAFIDLVGELFATHFNGFLDFTAERLDQFSKAVAESRTVVIRFADVQNEYRLVFFQNKPLFFEWLLFYFVSGARLNLFIAVLMPLASRVFTASAAQLMAAAKAFSSSPVKPVRT